MKVRPRKFDKAVKKSADSNTIKSTRRVFFVSSDNPEPLSFRADHFGGMGTGTLIKIEETYFLLTAKHVIIKSQLPGFKLGDDLHNSSPFWVLSRNRFSDFSKLESYLFPKKIWDIGELIKTEIDGIDTSDICLIELCTPNLYELPDNFIEIHSMSDVDPKGIFSPGKSIHISGYPFIQNGFTYEGNKPGTTHETKVDRGSYLGTYMEDEGCIKHNAQEYSTGLPDLAGISGGAVTGIHAKANQVKLSGMVVSSSGGISRFIPSYVFIDALLNYRQAKYYIVDPRAIDFFEAIGNPELVKDLMAAMEDQ